METQRDKFERWYAQKGTFTAAELRAWRAGRGYSYSHFDRAWKAWMAGRRALQSERRA